VLLRSHAWSGTAPRVVLGLQGYARFRGKKSHENLFRYNPHRRRLDGPPLRVQRPRRDHSALNGTWTLAPTKSDFRGEPVVQTGTVTISDRQGVIIVSRNFVYAGAAATYFYRDITDAENNATIHTGKDFKSKTRWITTS